MTGNIVPGGREDLLEAHWEAELREKYKTQLSDESIRDETERAIAQELKVRLYKHFLFSQDGSYLIR